jgi:hypothetical protein
MKQCSKCNEQKSFENFYKDRKAKDGYQSQCKQCRGKGINEYYKNNPDKRYYSKESSLKKYYKHKVHSNVARLVRRGLVEHTKSKPTFELLGYSVEQLKQHLESQFTKGMTWDNYGEWHIDHITPRAKLKYETTDDENFKKCWSLDNLQPLWALDNIKKSDKQ